MRWQPVASWALLCAILMAMASVVTLWYWHAESIASNEQLRSARALPRATTLITVGTNSGHVDLPAFSSADFTDQFLSTARDVHVPTDEVSYSLETGAGQPYWRYRITVDLKTGYPELRKFIAALASSLPNVALDAVRCRREDAASAGLSCQLAFSAFFRKEVRG